ncbi:MAG: transporter substrate-binding domain-containing protein [Spirochaetales bacterium]|nr:transporter substrate-binding domain-containing protein [Spirochaetales bacterium]
MKIRTLFLFFMMTFSSIMYAEEIRVLYNSNYYPFEFTNTQGNAEGFVIDLFYALARESALEISFIPGNWKHRDEDMYNGDGFFSTGYQSESAGESIIHSKILFSVPFSLIFRTVLRPHELKDLNDKTPLFSSGDSSEDLLFRQLEPENAIRTKSWSDALKALDKGYGDYTIISTAQKDLLMGDFSETLSVMDGFSLVLPYVIYTTRWDKKKLEKLDNGLSIIRASGEFDRIVGKWFGDKPPLIRASSKEKRTLFYLIPAIIACIFLMIINKKRKVRL